MKMDTVFCALLALILFLLHKIIQTNYYLTQLNYEVKKIQLQNDKDKSRTLEELRNATKQSEQVLKQFKNKDEKEKSNDIADTETALNESDKFKKVVHRSVGPHNNNNTYVNINLNLSPMMPALPDFIIQTLKTGGPDERLLGNPLKALKY